MRRLACYNIRATLLSARRSSSKFSTSPSLARERGDHSAESYFKEVDDSSDKVQRPHKPPSGKFSQAGVGSEEYRTVDKQVPYDPPSNGEASKKLRYGGKK
ncbi:hypothetical protein EI94DRAFT_1719125 [Lactarius quietus]|nr:hypothetical protein EI94DRAFT_1719125 [Lactarius quietus]